MEFEDEGSEGEQSGPGQVRRLMRDPDVWGWPMLGAGLLLLLVLGQFIGSLGFVTVVFVTAASFGALTAGTMAVLWGHPVRTSLLAVAIALALALPMFLVTPDHLSAYGDGPQDLGYFRDDMRGQGWEVRSGVTSPVLATDEDPAVVLLLVIGVERPYQDWEVELLVDFVQRGGHLVVADDFGHGNALARALSAESDTGASVQFFNAPLYPGLRSQQMFRDDALHNSSALVPVEAEIGEQRFIVATNVPSGLAVAGEVVYLANSTNDSVIDRNDSGTIDLFDKTGPIPVVVEVAVDKGKAVFVSDPSIFTNEMMGAPGDRVEDNANFSLALVEHLGGAWRTIVFDESRHVLVGQDSDETRLSAVFRQPAEVVATPGSALMGVLVQLTRASVFAPIVVALLLLLATWLLTNAPAKGDMRHNHTLDERQGGAVQLHPVAIQRRVKKLILGVLEDEMGMDYEYRRNTPDRLIRDKIGHPVLAQVYFDHHVPLGETECMAALSWLADHRKKSD